MHFVMGVRITCPLGLCLLLGCASLWAFNLDDVNVLRKNGDPGSLFGFSLAMHRQLQPMDRRLLLVGAPRANGLRGQKSKVTGGLYACDMSSTSSSCNRIIFDNQEDLSKENKENQWMGVSVSSQGPGGKIMTCAHRYQIRSAVNTAGESRDITGRCYMLNEDLTINEASGTGEGGNWHFCEGRPKGHEMFGSCQQGVAAIFDNDFHYVIFGAPGGYNWKGIVRLEQKNMTLVELGIYDDGPFELGDESEKDPNLIQAPANSYLGFSLDSGTSLTVKGQLTVVAGAPRANHSGAVVLLKKVPATRAVVEEYILEGEGLASSFGYDVAVLDFNADGWEDIVVGAPQYFEKDGEIGGAVYVYINKAGKWNEATRSRIDGPKDSMFGLAVAKIGDINQDGYHDFAVGAPNYDNGMGSVYIYHGSPTGLKSTRAAQILLGKPLGMKMFGYSLAGNMDLDKNSYPDLAVGSLSDAVVLYRARPVISIDKKITFTPKEIDLTNKNCGDKVCISVEACFTYTANPPSYSPKLTISYTMEADADHRKNGLASRATFAGASSKGTLTLDSKGKKKCLTRELVLQENIRDKLQGIPVDVSIQIEDAKRKRRQSVATPAPVLDANEPNSTRSMVHFLKQGCGDDNVCESNLQVKYRYGYRTINDETFTPLSMENGVPVISLSDQKEIALEVTVTNENGDDAYEASVNATLPSTLVYSAYRSSPDHPVTCIANKEGTKTKCDLGNPFKGKTETSFYIILGTAGISLNTTEVAIELVPYTTSRQTIVPVIAKAKVALLLQLSVSGLAKPSQASFSGVVKGESAMKSESDIGSAIAHQFRIINLGKRLTDFGTASLEIDWPKETENSKWLLYLVKISATGLDYLDCSPKSVINSLKVEQSKTRSRRAVTLQDEATISRLVDKKYKVLSCGKGAKCVKIKCPLRGLDSNAVITLSSRLWNTTFIEDYSDQHHVEVIVKASLSISSTLKNTKLQNAETAVSLTVFPERRSAQYGGVPWWIILLSILFGLLLLALLAFLLWKCGVFDKKDKEDTSEKERLTNA
ncbi:integrin alpha-6-like isoform X2 [Boleophthalmus pectinirostris]|uniref:integrin alpha-6-like isoform X2 n=1 Tax=Boleophthalmus pectinirostris TaxID=150288 RepID=UPI0024316B3E|nr:integrin alpha-6-like isoform X2 [Boleophthalmus pectinirostris]